MHSPHQPTTRTRPTRHRRPAAALAAPTAALVTVLVTVMVTASAARAATIDTTPTWNRTDASPGFGVPNTATYGQLITLDEPQTLADFTVYVRGTAGADLVVRPYVYAWDAAASRATGDPLFAGAATAITATADFVPYQTPTPGTALTPGEYVLLLTASNPPDYQASTGRAAFGVTRGDAYDGGDFVYLNSGPTMPAVPPAPWTYIPSADLAFRADLAVPEPAALSGLALAGPTLLGRRRRRPG